MNKVIKNILFPLCTTLALVGVGQCVKATSAPQVQDYNLYNIQVGDTESTTNTLKKSTKTCAINSNTFIEGDNINMQSYVRYQTSSSGMQKNTYTATFGEGKRVSMNYTPEAQRYVGWDHDMVVCNPSSNPTDITVKGSWSPDDKNGR